MSAVLDSLNPSFRPSVDRILALLKAQHNLVMIPVEGKRTLETQAKYWRQGRPWAEIQSKIQYLKDHDAPYLADVLMKVGPQNSPKKVTDAIPGYSWHNWGYAVDCYVSDEGDPKKLVMNGNDPRYKIYADLACQMGLGAGYYFTKKKADGSVERTVDAVHIQYYTKEIPNLFTLKDVNNHFSPKN